MGTRDILIRHAGPIFDHLHEGLMITDANSRIHYVNHAFTQVTGFSMQDVEGKRPSVLNSGRHGEEFYRAMWKEIRETGQWQGEIWNRRKNGDIYLEWLTVTAIRDEEGNVHSYVGVFYELTRQHNFAVRLGNHALHDFLTGLPGRDLFRDLVETAMSGAARNRQMAAVLLVSLDNVETIRNAHGAELADALVKLCVERMEHRLRDTGALFRFSDTVFAVLMQSLNFVSDAAKLANELVEDLMQPFSLYKHQLTISPYAGISVYPNDAKQIDLLVEHAETAMDKARELEGRRYQYFASNTEQAMIERMEWAKSLRRALDQEEFQLYYQPQYDLEHGRLIGVEALLRWKHPVNGLIPPLDFIPFAEETGLIVPIGEWVLRTACQQAVAMNEGRERPVRMSVNLSARQFLQNDLVSMVERVLRETGLDPAYLELELTESIFLNDVREAIETLKNLQNIGIQLAIDDFGTGYSSLSYISYYPMNVLKIDKSFIRDITTNRTNATIFSSVVQMAHSLHMRVVAEGIETDEQLEYLRSCGCDLGQGYLYSKPLPVEELAGKLMEG